MGKSCRLRLFGVTGRQRPQCDGREAFLCRDSDEHRSCWGKGQWILLVFCARALFLAGHLTAQRALKLEMMLLPPARRRWLPCHTAYAGRHKSWSVNKDLPRSTTSHSSCVLIFVNAVLSLSILTLLSSHFSFLCLLLTISLWLFLFPLRLSPVM